MTKLELLIQSFKSQGISSEDILRLIIWAEELSMGNNKSRDELLQSYYNIIFL